ncbi:MAG: LuxR C-terminal-related transcriptional regulator [Flavobacteriales bacterium]|nr:LuxR C-terminal-related transcriptional regulator [Flavobacteriales bacterium]
MKRIAIITADTLHSLGLQNILVGYFAPVEVEMMNAFDVEEARLYDYFFISVEEYASNINFFSTHHNFMLLSTHNAEKNVLDVCECQEKMLERINDFFRSHQMLNEKDAVGKTLSDREIQVLTLVATGCINKEIAEKLSISFNTVLTHRKNITAKLGIKTVSGLTFYAMMHGYVSSSDVSSNEV